MTQKVIAGITVNISEEGYFINPDQWTRELARELALEGGLVLTEKHMEILEFIRDRFITGHSLSIRSIGNSGITNIKEFYYLFPGAPMKVAAKLAGVPKPAGCF